MRQRSDGRLPARGAPHGAAMEVGTPRGRTDACHKPSGEEKTISTPCERNLGQEGPALPGLHLLETETESKTQISIELAAEEVVSSLSDCLLTQSTLLLLCIRT